MGTKCNQDAYAYLTQACALALEYLHQIDLVYVPGKRDKVVAAIKSKLKKAKRAQNIKEEKFTSTNKERKEILLCSYGGFCLARDELGYCCDIHFCNCQRKTSSVS